MNKLPIKKRVELLIQQMMKQAVADARFMNISWLGVGNIKRVVISVPIGFICQLVAKLKNIVHKPYLKQNNIFFLSFTAKKRLPGVKQVFNRYDIIE